MPRFLSVLVTLLVLATLHICIAQDDDDTESWGFEAIRDMFQIPVAHSKNYRLVLDRNFYLGHTEECSNCDNYARLVSKPSATTTWMMRSDNQRVWFENNATGLFLTYDPKNPLSSALVGRSPQYFVLNHLGGGLSQILTTEPIDGIQRALGKRRDQADPTLVGLCEPSITDMHQLWQLRRQSSVEPLMLNEASRVVDAVDVHGI
ncbi:hypothetical protein BGZ73_004982 [Actinomortierella ambigua]|nr:hypothetical protein BGZ73_004982 [Actinomortierella ambigua]